MKNKTTKILLIIVLVLAVVTGVLVWVAFGTDNTPDAPAVPAAETTESTEAAETTEAIQTTEATQATETIETIPETTVPETTVPETTVPETTVPETTIPEPTETEPPATEPAWEPQKLTQADFTDKLTDLTDEERKAIYLMQYDGGDMYRLPEEDISLTFPQYANLDLDKDGKTDKFFYTNPGLELRMGNGNVSALDVDLSDLGAGYSAGMLFSDINNTGKDDILLVHVSHSTAGNLLSFTVYVDSGSRYYRQEIPNYKFYLEDLHNDYVRLSCADFPYREVMLIGGTECHPYLEENQSIFDFYFGQYPNGKVDSCKIRSVKLDGSKLVVLYDFMQKHQAAVTSNPFGVVYRLEPGGYFIIERMGTEVIRDYWLPIENESAP